ncbi:Outer membrane protein W precursor [hydrothermal vent metagenome]|uniref:Outer membrane protein W n=1 Tax=hydrothermal vent metagenome TaxID=652676 RepID=A0A3B0RJA8_9ZZZZ
MTKLTKLIAIALATTLLSSGAALAEDYGPWQVRVRMITIAPQESSTVSIGGFSDHSVQIVPEVDISYFFSDNWSAELILATSKHSANGWNTALGDLDLGSIWVLPPTLTLQYHLMPGQIVNPYVGAGANLTFFYGQSFDAGSPIIDISHSASFGPALQAGVDIQTGGDWFLNLDLKKIWIQTDAVVNAGALGVATADVSLDPLVFGVGIGRRF